MEDEENIFMPNAYLEQDPKPVLAKLAEYSIKKEMKFFYKKNAHKIKYEVPMSDNKFISFWIIFEKGRKKSTKGLYRLKFHLEH
jgi:adenine-specific DNA methylase